MGLFSSSNDAKDTGGDEATMDRVDGLVADVRDQSGEARNGLLRDLSSYLATREQDATVAARALTRLAWHNPDMVEPVVEEAIDHLAECELARPIAEGVLEAGANMSDYGLELDIVVEGLFDARDEALGRIEAIRTDTGMVAGGGASEIALASALRGHADSVDGQKQLGVEAGADALENVPQLLARRAGLDALETLVEMRMKHDQSELMGIDTEQGTLRDVESADMQLPEPEFRRRLTKGFSLGMIVFCTRDTVTQLEAITGYDPYPA